MHKGRWLFVVEAGFVVVRGWRESVGGGRVSGFVGCRVLDVWACRRVGGCQMKLSCANIDLQMYLLIVER
jgi:hypothetical protein